MAKVMGYIEELTFLRSVHSVLYMSIDVCTLYNVQCTLYMQSNNKCKYQGKHLETLILFYTDIV